MNAGYTQPMGFLSRFFKKKVKKPTKEILKELVPGDLVYIKFKAPPDIGIISGHDLSLMRLNPLESSKREIIGTISFNKVMEAPLLSRVIEIVTLSSPDMPGRTRRMTFLEDEIETVRKIENEQ